MPTFPVPRLAISPCSRYECFQPSTCPCCYAQFLQSSVTSRHLVHHHPEFICRLLEDSPSPSSASPGVNNKHVFCRFCGQKFFRKHIKLLALHIQQTHRTHFDNAVKNSVIGGRNPRNWRQPQDNDASVASFEASLLITPARGEVRGAGGDSPRPPRRLVHHQGLRQTLSAGDHQHTGPGAPGRKQGLELRFSVPETHLEVEAENALRQRIKGKSIKAKD